MLLKPRGHDQAPTNRHMSLRWCCHILYSSVEMVKQVHPMTAESRMQVIEEQIRIIKDFPKPGILFRDITTFAEAPTCNG